MILDMSSNPAFSAGNATKKTSLLTALVRNVAFWLPWDGARGRVDCVLLPGGRIRRGKGDFEWRVVRGRAVEDSERDELELKGLDGRVSRDGCNVRQQILIIAVASELEGCRKPRGER